MKLQLADITEETNELRYPEDVTELNARLGRGLREYRVAEGLEVETAYYRFGQELFFRGALRGEVQGTCARCAEEYTFMLETPFTFVLVPRPTLGGEELQLSAEDMALSFYEGTEIDVTPLVHEQVILALPTRPLCREDCRGLCPRCGANLNAATCSCPADPSDPRLAVLRTLVRGR
jgi:uncharacterized protein